MGEDIKKELVNKIVQDFIDCSGDCTKCKASLKVLEVMNLGKEEHNVGCSSFSYCRLLRKYKEKLVERITKLLDKC